MKEKPILDEQGTRTIKQDLLRVDSGMKKRGKEGVIQLAKRLREIADKLESPDIEWGNFTIDPNGIVLNASLDKGEAELVITFSQERKF